MGDNNKNVAETPTEIMIRQWREYLLHQRQLYIMGIGKIEDTLGMERSIVPRHKRKKAEQATGDEVV